MTTIDYQYMKHRARKLIKSEEMNNSFYDAVELCKKEIGTELRTDTILNIQQEVREDLRSSGYPGH